MIHALTADWTDAADIPAYSAMCDVLEIQDDTVPIQVWANESDNYSTAWNRGGNASGIFQAMPATLKGLGYDLASDPTLGKFRSLSIHEQLVWATRYYANHKGQTPTVAAFYLCTFMPALLSCASNPQATIASPTFYPGAYAGNWTSFDVLRDSLGHPVPDENGHPQQHKGFIVVQDLVDAAARATGPRTHELMDRVRLYRANAITQPGPSV